MSVTLPRPIDLSKLTKLDKYELVKAYINSELNRYSLVKGHPAALTYYIKSAATALDETLDWYVDPEMASGIIINPMPGAHIELTCHIMHDLLFLLQKDRISAPFNGTIISISHIQED